MDPLNNINPLDNPDFARTYVSRPRTRLARLRAITISKAAFADEFVARPVG